MSELLPVLRQLSDHGDLLTRIEAFLQMNETDIECNVTLLRLGTELIMKDGNARAIAFYERRKRTPESIQYPVFLVEMVKGNP